MRILIIDDSTAVHAYIKNCFSVTCHDTVNVYNGQEALNLLESDHQFDMILMDWEMPVLNGPETMEVMILRNYKIPVLMMTSRNSHQDIVTMLDKGVNEYMLKPFTSDILFQKMELVSGMAVSRAS
jgi:two-component system chemotaxis response regulator CheY